MDSEAKDVMTVPDLCAYLQLSEANVREMLRRGKIPAALIGRQWRIRKTAVDAWLEAQERTRPAYRRRLPREPAQPTATIPGPKPPRQPRPAEKAPSGARKPPPEPAPAEASPEERNRMAREVLERDRQASRTKGRA